MALFYGLVLLVVVAAVLALNLLGVVRGGGGFVNIALLLSVVLIAFGAFSRTHHHRQIPH
jgi:hypothetical protein